MTISRHHPSQRRAIWPPETGTFAFRLVRDGWRVPARIVRDDDDAWHAEIDGESYAKHADPAQAPMVSAIWHSAIRLPEADFRWLQAVKDHARLHDPGHPALHPRKRMDPRVLKPISF